VVSAAKGKPAGRFTRLRWLDFALNVLGRHGPAALTLDSLCARAKRTKGSFYHHIEDHSGFIDALTAHWRKKHLADPIEGSSTGSAESRLADLNTLASQIDPGIELGFRQLADRYPSVRKAVQRTDEERLAYLVELYLADGLRKVDATSAAKVQYAGFIGALTLWPDSFETDAQRLGLLVDKLLRNEFSRARRHG
jgi:AcrR family transcriptional regulator